MRNKNENKNEIDPEIENAAATLSALREQIDALAARLVTGARGTRDVTREAAVAQAPALKTPPAPATLPERVEQLLRERVASLEEISRALGVPAGRASITLRAFGRQVHNVGSEDRPRWTWVIGDDGPTPELVALCERLLRERPMVTAELVAATGARTKRVDGALVQLQRRRVGLRNLGGRNRARWFVVPPSGERAQVRR